MKHRDVDTGDEPVSSAGDRLPRPKRLLIVTALSVFLGEVLVMFLLMALPPIPPVIEAIADGMMVTLLAAPVLYLSLFRPMQEHIQHRKRAEDELTELNERLERIVKDRTAGLEESMRQLSREIEQHRSTAESLRRSNEFIERVVERAPCLMMTFDADTLRYIYANSRITDVLGYEQDDLVVKQGTLIEEYIDDRDRAAFEHMVREIVVAREGEVACGTCGFVSAAGEVVSMHFGLTVLNRTATMEAKDLLIAVMPAWSADRD